MVGDAAQHSFLVSAGRLGAAEPIALRLLAVVDDCLVLVDPVAQLLTSVLPLRWLHAVAQTRVRGAGRQAVRATFRLPRDAIGPPCVDGAQREIDLVLLPRYERDLDALLLGLLARDRIGAQGLAATAAATTAVAAEAGSRASEVPAILDKLRETVGKPHHTVVDMEDIQLFDAEAVLESSRGAHGQADPSPRFRFPSDHATEPLVLGLSQTHVCLARVSHGKTAGSHSHLLLVKEPYAGLERLHPLDAQTTALCFASGRVLGFRARPALDMVGLNLTLLGRAALARRCPRAVPGQGAYGGDLAVPLGWLESDSGEGLRQAPAESPPRPVLHQEAPAQPAAPTVDLRDVDDVLRRAHRMLAQANEPPDADTDEGLGTELENQSGGAEAAEVRLKSDDDACRDGDSTTSLIESEIEKEDEVRTQAGKAEEVNNPTAKGDDHADAGENAGKSGEAGTGDDAGAGDDAGVGEGDRQDEDEDGDNQDEGDESDEGGKDNKGGRGGDKTRKPRHHVLFELDEDEREISTSRVARERDPPAARVSARRSQSMRPGRPKLAGDKARKRASCKQQ